MKIKLDPKFLTKKVPDMERRAGMRQGSLVRKIMQRSFRPAPKKKKVTTGPPRSRTGLMRRFVIFRWDEKAQSVVIGPKDLPRLRIDDQLETLDQGLVGEYFDYEGVKRLAKYRQREFRQPAFDTAKSKLPQLFEGTLR